MIWLGMAAAVAAGILISVFLAPVGGVVLVSMVLGFVISGYLKAGKMEDDLQKIKEHLGINEEESFRMSNEEIERELLEEADTVQEDWRLIEALDERPIEISSLDPAELDRIQPLWELLREHHEQNSPHFGDEIARNTFRKRSKQLLAKLQSGELRILAAYDASAQSLVGYCVSSIDSVRQGEIDSVFVLEDYRGQGVGDRLLNRTLEWFDINGVTSISLSVLYGNEGALKFYERYGFHARAYILKNNS